MFKNSFSFGILINVVNKINCGLCINIPIMSKKNDKISIVALKVVKMLYYT